MKPCKRDGCEYPKRQGGHLCYWHWLEGQPPEVQIQAAATRRALAEEAFGLSLAAYRARVPKSEWPEGERWCSKCQAFIPLFYCRGSVCKAHASQASHAARTEREYGITGEEYDALLELQGGLCYVCRQPPKSKRLAVDHDHATGVVRGLLCAGEWGCNFSVLGGLEKRSKDGGLAAARRLVEYLEHTPYERLGEVMRREGRPSAAAPAVLAQPDDEQDPLRRDAPF